jgi:hypothetical protein
MDSYTDIEGIQLGLWSTIPKSEIWGAAWYWIWLSRHLRH